MLRRFSADPLQHAWRLALLLGAAGAMLGWLFALLAGPEAAAAPVDAWQSTALLVALTALLGYAVGASIALWSVSRHSTRVTVAINNMSQGLCMFDADARLLVSNDRYGELYQMTPEITRPGTSLRDLLRHRHAMGNFPGDPEVYFATNLRRIAEGEPYTIQNEINGRTILVSNRPMAGGGWVSTHQDISERRRED
jgi:methyl-accepting chemotaxis protein